MIGFLCWIYLTEMVVLKVSLVSKDSSMLDGLDNASIEMEEAKVCKTVMYFVLL